MFRRWSSVLATALALGAGGCAHGPRPPEGVRADADVGRAAYRPPDPDGPLAMASGPAAPPDLSGPQPVDALVRRALAENRTVQAAFHNVQSLRQRVPQVMALDDPTASNSVFPIPGVAPQYSLMGYNPYNLTLAQQFPWFGTLRLRGEAAEKDVQVALAELAAAQLDAVAAVKRAYYNLHAGLRSGEILVESRKVLEDFREIARERLEAGGTQQDVLRAEVLISELDRELAVNAQATASARSALARQLHVRPDSDLRTLPALTFADLPAEFERLDRMAAEARPELRGRLAAVARDAKAVELARKRFYPNVTLGLTYMDMEKTNAQTPKTAGGMPNVGLFVGFNLPVYRAKYRAGVCEAEHRAAADAKLYEAQRDETASEVQDAAVQVKAQQGVLALLRDSILPRTSEAFRLVLSDYAGGNVDAATAYSALREQLQVRLQVAQVEAELGKAIASLERAVGTEINALPPAPAPAAAPVPAPPPPPPPAESRGPFRPATHAPADTPGP